MELSGWVFTALSLMVLGYLVPYLVHRREVLVESRVSDRFSQHLRLVEPGRPPGTTAGHGSETRPLVHAPEVSRRRTEALAMIRPTAPAANRVNAREMALARATRAAEISRRAAAGRRRLTLCLLVGVVAVATWAATSIGALAWGWALLPTALLAGVVHVARKAAVVAARQDAKARAEMTRLDQRLRLFRDAESVPAAVPPRPSSAAPALSEAGKAEASPADASAAAPLAPQTAPREAGEAARFGVPWTPRAVPLPTYTLKQETPRRSAEPFVPAQFDDGGVRVPVRPTATAPTSQLPEEESPVASTFDLDSVLARRRAAGA